MVWRRLILIRMNLSRDQELSHEASLDLRAVHFKEEEAGKDLRAGTEEEVVIGTFKEQVREDTEAIAKAGEETKVTVGVEILAEKITTIKENHMSMLTLSLKKPEMKQKLKLKKMLKK